MDYQIINNRYQIIRNLGEGSMGKVYLVEDLLLEHRLFALKTIKPQLINDQSLKIIDRFKKEFEVMSKLHHPNLIKVFSFQKDFNADQYLIKMEYLDGLSLKEIMKRDHNLSIEFILSTMVSLLRALEFIHSRNILYRDLKPENIIVGEQGLKLLDFGLSDLMADDERQIKGTLNYMAPEVFGGEIDRGVDIFAAGVLFYQLLSGESFYNTSNNSSIISTLSSGHFFKKFSEESLAKLSDERFKKIISGMTAYKKEKRYTSCAAVLSDLSSLIDSAITIESKETSAAYVTGAPFIAREKELQALIDNLANNNQQLLLLQGSTGSGKSSLFTEFSKYCQLNNLFFFSGHSFEPNGKNYHPLLQIIEEMLYNCSGELRDLYGSELVKLLPNHQRLNGILPALHHDALTEKQIIEESITNFIIDFAQSCQQLSVLYFSDLHNCDEDSIKIINEIIFSQIQSEQNLLKIYACADSEHIGIIQSAIDQFKEKNRLQQIALEPFSQQEVISYLQSCFGYRNTSNSLLKAIDTLYQNIGGNPLLWQELLKDLVENELIQRKSLQWESVADLREISTPKNLQAILQKHISKLRENQTNYNALELLSCMNGQFSVAILQEILSDSAVNINDFLDCMISEAVLQSETVHDQVKLNFCQNSMKELIYAGLPNQQKIVNHGKIAVAGEKIFDHNLISVAEELAYHYSNSNHREKALHYLELAGNKSKEIFANKKALNYFSRYLEISPPDNVAKTIEILIIIAELQERTSNWDRAVQNYMAAQKLISGTNNQQLDAKIKTGLAIVYTQKCEYALASQLLEEALAAFKSLSDQTGISECLLHLGNISDLQSDNTAALNFYNQKLEIDLKNNYTKGIANAYYGIGMIYQNQSKFAESEEYLLKSLEIAKSSGEKRICVHVISSISHLLVINGDYPKAMQYYRLNIKIAKELGDKKAIASSLIGIGIIHRYQGDYKQAKENYQKCLQIADEIGDKKMIGIVTGNLGIIYEKENNIEQAIACYKTKIKISQELSNKNSLSIAYCNLGNVLISDKQYDQALEYYTLGLNIAKELENKQNMAIQMVNIANVYRKKSDFVRALEIYGECRQIAEEIKDRHLYGVVLENTGEVNYLLNRYEQALDYFEQSLKVATELGEKRSICNLNMRIAETYQNMGEDVKALKNYQICLNLAKALSENDIIRRILLNKANIYKHQGEFERAEKNYDAALEAAKSKITFTNLDHPEYVQPQILLEKADLLWRTGKIAESQILNNQAYAKLTEVKAENFLFLSEILSCKIDFSQKLTGAAEKLARMLLRSNITDEQTAITCYELYIMTKENSYYDQAILCYTKLIQNYPKVSWQNKISELKKIHQNTAQLFTSSQSDFALKFDSKIIRSEEPNGLIDQYFANIQRIINSSNKSLSSEMIKLKREIKNFSSPQNLTEHDTQIEYLKELLEITKDLNSNLNINLLLEKIVNLTIKFTDSDRGILLLYNSDNELEVLVARDREQREISSTESIVPKSLIEKVISTKLPIFETNIDSLTDYNSASILSLNLKSVFCIPLKINFDFLTESTAINSNEFIGFLYVDSQKISEKNKYISDNLDYLKTLGDQAALALNNAQLAANIKEQNQKLVKSHSDIEFYKNYLAGIIQSMPVMIIAVLENGEISTWNAATVKITGISKEDAEGKPFWQVAQFLAEFKTQYLQVLNSGLIRKQDKVYYNLGTTENEDLHCLHISLVPLMTNDLKNLVFIIDDLTEMEKQEEQLRQIQKMETIGTLAGGLAHDFNNVLSGIVGTVSLMKYKFNKYDKLQNEDLKNYISTIANSSQRAVDMVQQLLSLSHKQKSELVPVDLNLSIKHVLKICRNTFDKSIEISSFLPDNPVMVNADPTQIEQVLLNLCINASHAMTIMRSQDQKNRNLLTISIGSSDRSKESIPASQLTTDKGKYWTVAISDTGVGMSSKTVEKIFDPFFTTKVKGTGTGLGLTMVKNIVEQHWGFIEIETKLDLGSTFKIYLPALEDPQDHNEELPKIELSTGKGVILVVDDEEIMRDIYKNILETCGYRVIFAVNGEEGVRKFIENRATISAIIMDIMMPVMDGREATLEIIKMNNNTKILLASGFKYDERVNSLAEIGIKHFIAKPFTLQTLSTAVYNLLNE